MKQLYHLPPGHTIAISIADDVAHVRRTDEAEQVRVTNVSPVTFGPYAIGRSFLVQHNSVVPTVTIAEADTTVSTAQKAMLDNVPVADAEDGVTVWADEGTLKVSTGA